MNTVTTAITSGTTPTIQNPDGGIVLSYTPYIPIQSLSPSPSSPLNPSQTPDSIDPSSSSPSSPSFTKKDEQTHRSKALKTILSHFLLDDLSSQLPELGSWVGWSKQRGYSGSRIIVSGNQLHLLALRLDGGLDDYELPYSRGGLRKPVLRHTFSSIHLGILESMMTCKNVSDGHGYCGYCPSCLAFHTDRTVFVNKRAKIRKLESELNELDDLIQKGAGLIRRLRRQVVWAEKRGWTAMAKVMGRKADRLEGWASDPQKHHRLRESELEGLRSSQSRSLNRNSVLIQQPHWFTSISCPTALHPVFDAHDAWMPKRVVAGSRRTPDTLQGILDDLDAMPQLNHGFGILMRLLFRKLVLETVQAQHPGIRLTMEHQLHPFNKWDNAPDVHCLVSKWGQEKASGRLVEVEFDGQALHRELETRMQGFAEFVVWAMKRWNGGCRAAEFRAWRQDVLSGVATVRSQGIPVKTVDIVRVPVSDLLNVHCYLRRQPMENVQSLYLDRDRGMVKVRYFRETIPAEFSVINLLWRFVGFDGRGFGVQYAGAYRSIRGMKRGVRMDGVYRDMEAKLEAETDEARVAQAALTGRVVEGSEIYVSESLAI